MAQANTKINVEELEKMYREGFTGREMAKRFQCTPGAISKKLKAMKLSLTQDVVLNSAVKINSRKINAMDRLDKTVSRVEDEIEKIEEGLKNKKGEDRLALSESKLKYLAEARKQLGLVLEISKTLYNLEEVQRFQQTVMEVLNEVDPKIREEVLKRLKQLRSAQSVLGGDGSSL